MKELINSIAKKEWRFIWLMAVVIMVLTGLPYLLGYLMAPPGATYDGLHSLSPGDIPIYYSYINFTLLFLENRRNIRRYLRSLNDKWDGFSISLV